MFYNDNKVIIFIFENKFDIIYYKYYILRSVLEFLVFLNENYLIYVYYSFREVYVLVYLRWFFELKLLLYGLL